MKINYLLTLFTILGIFASPSIATEFTMELLPKNKFEIQYSTCEVATIDIKDNAFNEKIININNAFNKKTINSNNVFNKKTINSNNVFNKKTINSKYNVFNKKTIGININDNVFDKKPIENSYNAFNTKPIGNINLRHNIFKSIDNIEDLPRGMHDITQENIKIDGVYLDTENQAVWLNGFDVKDNVKLLTFINSNSNYKNRVDNNSEYHHIVLNYSDNTTNLTQHTIQCVGFDTIELNIPYVEQPKVNPIISANNMKVFLNGFKIKDTNIVRKIA